MLIAQWIMEITDNYTNVQNCILLKYKCDQIFLPPPIPQSQNRSYGLVTWYKNRKAG